MTKQEFKAFRHKLGLTQEKMALLLHRCPRTIRFYENNNNYKIPENVSAYLLMINRLSKQDREDLLQNKTDKSHK
jgi:DNA-binding XRE family transcriptional regulator